MSLTKTILAAGPNDHNQKLIFIFLRIYFWFLVFGFWFCMFHQISKPEYRILCLVAMVLIIAGVVPYIVGYLKTPAGQVFLGTSPFNIADQPVYYTYIEQVKSGFLTNFDFFTPEKQARGIFQVSWFIPGVLARIFDISAIAAFHIWRIFLIPILVFVLYLFISLFFADKFSRFIAFLLALFGSGWGAYALAFLPNKFYSLPKFLPPDVWVPESNTFLSLMLTPHFVLSLIFLLLIFYFLILFAHPSPFGRSPAGRHRSSPSRREGDVPRSFSTTGIPAPTCRSLGIGGGGGILYAFLSGLCALILFSFHPYFAPLVYLILGLQAVLIVWQERKIFTSKILGLMIIFVLSSPSVLYHFYLLASEYVLKMRGIEMQESNFMPCIFAMLVGYGFFGLFGLLGATKNFKNIQKPEWTIAYLWLFSCLVLFFVPFVFPRRLTEGFQVPLALFSVIFLAPFLKQILTQGAKKFIIILIFAVLALAPTTIFNFTRFFNSYYYPGAEEPFFYRENGEIEAMRWLRQNTPPDSVILAAPWNGNIIPFFSQRKVFFGHMDETIFAGCRKAEADWFYKDNSNDALKKEFLKREGVSYVFWSEKEDSLGTFQPQNENYLQSVYQSGKVEIYKAQF